MEGLKQDAHEVVSRNEIGEGRDSRCEPAKGPHPRIAKT